MDPPPPPPPPPPAPFFTQNTHLSSSDAIGDQLTSSPLIDVIKAVDTSKVKELLDGGEDINQATILGTPLSVAVRVGNIALVKLLASHANCNINSRDYDGETPFCLSLRKQCTDISLYLLSRGCAINCLDPVTNKSLLATAVGQKNVEIVAAMLSQGCDVDMLDRRNLTPLAHACLLPERSSASEEDRELKIKLITMLYNAGADVNARVGPLSNGYLLHEVVLARCCLAIRILLDLDKKSSSDNQLDINRRNPIEKNTPLNLAVAICDKPIAQLLLHYGASTDIPNVFCDTPLSKALNDRLYDQSEVVRLLLDHGADPNFEDTTSQSRRRKGPCKPLFAALENGDKEMVQLLLKHGADLSSLDFMRHCPIMPCLANGLSIGLLHFIVDTMDEQHITYDISSWVYLHSAFPWTRHLQYLIDRGLHINASSPQGHKIIHTNAVKFYPNSLEVLLENGLDPDSPSADGNTMLASCAGLPKYWLPIQLLVQYGADVNRIYVSDSDLEALTPLQRAFIAEYEEDQNMFDGSSQFLYLLNCGALLTSDMYLWRDAVVADRIAVTVSEDESDSDSSVESGQEISDNQKVLLSHFQLSYACLPLKMCCRKIIRSTILQAVPPGQVKKAVYSLPLPTSLKEFVALVNVPTSLIIR